MKRFATLALVASVATYLLIVLGGLVRATGAGLACPDWPICHGRLIPPLEGLVLIEYAHRLVASLVGFLTLAVTIGAWRRGIFRWHATLALVLVGVQIVLGGLTVRTELSPWLVVAHLGTAMTFFATLVGLTLRAWTTDVPPRRSSMKTLAWITLAATFGLVLIGGYVSATAAVFAYRVEQGRDDLRALSAVAVGLLALQVLLGALNVEYQLAAGVTTSHLATAAALFATLVMLAVLSGRARVPGDATAPVAGGRPPGRRDPWQRAMSYVALTKPRIIVLLLITAFAAMLVAANGVVSPWIIVFTLAGGAASAGAANA